MSARAISKVLFVFCLSLSSYATLACTIPNTLTNGQVADATQVMANFNSVANCAEGKVNATGSPASGSLPVFSGSKSIASGNLTGDVSTSGSTVTTLSTTGVTPGNYSNPNVTVDAKGRITAVTNGIPGGTSALLGEFVATGGETTVTLSSLAQSFGHLEVFIVGNTASGAIDLKMYANGDTNNSNYRDFTWNKWGSGSAGYPRVTTFQGSGVPSTGAATVTRITIFDYSRSAWKKSASSDVQYQDSPNFFRSVYDWFWNNTSAISSLTFTLQSSSFSAGTRVQVYGYGS